LLSERFSEGGFAVQRNFDSLRNILPVNQDRVDSWGWYLLGEVSMKKTVLATAAVFALLSAAGCVGIGKGKGKAPPIVTPPIITKG
jgi:hypothetical protein